jgi:hypothetical protein
VRLALFPLGVLIITLGSACGEGGDGHGTAHGQQCEIEESQLSSVLTTSGLVRRVAARERFIDPDVLQQVIATAAGPRIVAALSWGGLSGGVIALLTCDGTVLRAHRIGYIRSVDLSERLSAIADGAVVLVSHVTGQGTGWQQVSKTAYRAFPDSLVRIWSATEREISYQSAEVGAYEITAEIDVEGDSLIRRESRWTLTYDEATSSWKRDESSRQVTREIYIWDSTTQGFQRLRGDRRRGREPAT